MRSGRVRAYAMDDTALDVIDVEWKAYYLGLFAADGHAQGAQAKVKLHEKDWALLEQLNQLFQITHPLRKDGHAVLLYFASSRISDRLKELGLHGAKTTRLDGFPPIPHQLFPHFVRGFIDGDGSVGYRTARAKQLQVAIGSVARPFLEELQDWFALYGIPSQIYLEKRKGRKIRLPNGKTSLQCFDMFRLMFTTHEARIAVYELCWGDATIFLERKKAVWVKYADTQRESQKNGSYRFEWPVIYAEYMAGASLRDLSVKYGFYWRGFYSWMRRTGSPTRSRK